MRSGTGSALALAGLLTFTGAIHLIRPGVFDPIVPGWLPGDARFWTWSSGVAELGVAALVAWPRTRRIGGFAAATLFVAVFPANIGMALDADGTAERLVTWGRLPLQIPLILWALFVSRRPARQDRHRLVSGLHARHTDPAPGRPRRRDPRTEDPDANAPVHQPSPDQVR